jgi:hypothetical protein
MRDSYPATGMEADMPGLTATEGTRLHGQDRGEATPGPFPSGRGSDHNSLEDEVAMLMNDPWLATYWFTAYELL